MYVKFPEMNTDYVTSTTGYGPSAVLQWWIMIQRGLHAMSVFPVSVGCVGLA